MRRLLQLFFQVTHEATVHPKRLSAVLSVALALLAVYGFGSEVATQRDAAIAQAVQVERTQRDLLWQGLRGDLGDVKADLKEIRKDLDDLRVQVARLGR